MERVLHSYGFWKMKRFSGGQIEWKVIFKWVNCLTLLLLLLSLTIAYIVCIHMYYVRVFCMIALLTYTSANGGKKKNGKRMRWNVHIRKSYWIFVWNICIFYGVRRRLTSAFAICIVRVIPMTSSRASNNNNRQIEWQNFVLRSWIRFFFESGELLIFYTFNFRLSFLSHIFAPTLLPSKRNLRKHSWGKWINIYLKSSKKVSFVSLPCAHTQRVKCTKNSNSIILNYTFCWRRWTSNSFAIANLLFSSIFNHTHFSLDCLIMHGCIHSQSHSHTLTRFDFLSLSMKFSRSLSHPLAHPNSERNNSDSTSCLASL